MLIALCLDPFDRQRQQVFVVGKPSGRLLHGAAGFLETLIQVAQVVDSIEQLAQAGLVSVGQAAVGEERRSRSAACRQLRIDALLDRSGGPPATADRRAQVLQSVNRPAHAGTGIRPGDPVRLHQPARLVPQRGEKRRLLQMAQTNAREALEQAHARWLADRGKTEEALEGLQEELNLPAPPRRIECYDISNIQGTNSVGSMVVFVDGKPRTQEYRRFKIPTVEGSNDYAMIAEVLKRRFKRANAPAELDGGRLRDENDAKGRAWRTLPRPRPRSPRPCLPCRPRRASSRRARWPR